MTKVLGLFYSNSVLKLCKTLLLYLVVPTYTEGLHRRGWGRRVEGLESAWSAQQNLWMKTKAKPWNLEHVHAGPTRSSVNPSLSLWDTVSPLLLRLLLLSSPRFLSLLCSSLLFPWLGSLLFHLSTQLLCLLRWPARHWRIGTMTNSCVDFDLWCLIDAYWGICGALEKDELLDVNKEDAG